MEKELEITGEPKIAKVSEIQDKAKELKNKRTLPTKPGSKVSFQQMNDWLALLTPEMLEGNRVIIYVYRLDPPIIRQKVDPKASNNIDVIVDVLGGIKEDYFIETHGGGKYKLVIKDVDNPTDSKGFFESQLVINMQEYPPKVDLRDVDFDSSSCKGFRAWCKAKGLIDDNNMPVEIKSKDGSQLNTSDSMVQAMKLAMEFADKMSDKDREKFKRDIGGDNALGKSIGEIFLEKMKQEDPNKQLQTIVTLISAMKSMQPEPRPDNSMSNMMPIINMMMETSNKQFALLVEMMKQKNNAPMEAGKSKVEELKELIEVSKELSGEGGGKKSTTEAVIEGISTILGPALNLASQFFAAKNGAPIPPPTPVPNNNNVTQMPNTNQATQQTVQPQISQSEAIQMISQFGPIIINHLGGEGWEFGAWLSQGFGDPVAARVSRYSVEDLIAAGKSVPEFWQQIDGTYGEAHLRKWLASLINYKEEMIKIDNETEGMEQK